MKADRNDFPDVGDRCILAPPVLVASLTRDGFRLDSTLQLVAKRRVLTSVKQISGCKRRLIKETLPILSVKRAQVVAILRSRLVRSGRLDDTFHKKRPALLLEQRCSSLDKAGVLSCIAELLA